jgi:hypothetical protein
MLTPTEYYGNWRAKVPNNSSNQSLQPTRWPGAMTSSKHVYEIRPRKDRRGFDLISDVLPFGRMWYGEPDAVNNAIGYAKFFSRSHDAVIRVYDYAGNVIETHEQAGDFKEW